METISGYCFSNAQFRSGICRNELADFIM
jgi:hypothetical protein